MCLKGCMSKCILILKVMKEYILKLAFGKNKGTVIVSIDILEDLRRNLIKILDTLEISLDNFHRQRIYQKRKNIEIINSMYETKEENIKK